MCLSYCRLCNYYYICGAIMQKNNLNYFIMIKINDFSIVRDDDRFNVFRLDPSSSEIFLWVRTKSLFDAIKIICNHYYFKVLGL